MRFRLSPSATILGRSFANKLLEDQVESLNIIHSAEDYNVDFIDALESRYTQRGGYLSADIFLEGNKLSYSNEVMEIKNGEKVFREKIVKN